MALKKAINESKSQILEKKINECHGDQKIFFGIVDTMLGKKKMLYCQNMMIQPLWPLCSIHFSLTKLIQLGPSFHC